MFDVPFELEAGSHLLSTDRRRPRHCAWEMPLPEMKRVSRGLVGLAN